jgi:hypothetical protein
MAAQRGLSRRTIRRLRANARGRFRTRGRHSAATVRDTVWSTIDRCDGTLTKVTRGRVAVRDFRRKRTITPLRREQLPRASAVANRDQTASRGDQLASSRRPSRKR